MSRELLRKALDAALDSFTEGSLDWKNCRAARDQSGRLLIDDEFVGPSAKKAVVSILKDACEPLIEGGLSFLIRGMEEMIAQIEALPVQSVDEA